MNKEIEHIKEQMLTQDNRATSFPIFVVVEDQKIYGVSPANADGYERKDSDFYDGELCEECATKQEAGETLGETCADCPDEAFSWYRLEEHVPNMRAAFFFTAEACDAHIEANRHHYNETAKSYAISAYHNFELREVMQYIAGKELV